jgi:hypothetical protein
MVSVFYSDLCLRERVGAAIYRGDGVGGKALPHHQSASTPSITVG